MATARKIMIAIDGSEPSNNALLWACRHILLPGDELQLVTVMPPMAYSVYPVAPVATAAAVAAVAGQWEAQKRHDEAHATNLLREAAQLAIANKVDAERPHAHSLPAAGGASGVADSLVEFARVKEVAALVVGSRGLGSISRSFMSLVGLGSVSDYCIHQLHVPVVVVHHTAGASSSHVSTPPERHVVLSLDDSVHSQYALTWAAANILRAGDTVTCLTVALPTPYPIMDETSVTVAALEAQQWAASNERNLEYASSVAARAATHLAAIKPQGVTVRTAALPPAGGSSDAGTALCGYAEEHKVDVVVVGSRGMGSFKRRIMSFAGLGSVSDYAVHNCKAAAVAVIKATEDKLPATDVADAVPGLDPAAGSTSYTTKAATTEKED